MSEKLTPEELSTNWETQKHIDTIRLILAKFATELECRGQLHDKSKLERPEVEAFTATTAKLAKMIYGTPEYKEACKELGPALDHHYVCNRHHPECHKNGVDDMNLFDIVEMFCDWKAAGLRHKNGNLMDSIEHNKGRFKLEPQLVKILENTVEQLNNMVDPLCGP